jgi:hypothetical protein
MFFDHLIFSLPSTNLKDFRDSNLLPLRDLFSFGFSKQWEREIQRLSKAMGNRHRERIPAILYIEGNPRIDPPHPFLPLRANVVH